MLLGVGTVDNEKGKWMKRSRFYRFGLSLLSVWLLSSCSAYHPEVRGISYLSIQSESKVVQSEIPSSAEIIVAVGVDKDGNVDVVVQNNTDEIMIIDRTKSFFCDHNGNSTPYYDPTVNVLAESNTSGHTTGASVNLGTVARAVGVGGVAGALLSGVNVGGANQNASTTTNTTYFVDQPTASIAPHGKASMGGAFKEESFGMDMLYDLAQNGNTALNKTYTANDSFSSCNIVISYSVDEGKSYKKIETKLYGNSIIVSLVRPTGHVNDALRMIYMQKSDLFDEDWYQLCFGGSTRFDAFGWEKGIKTQPVRHQGKCSIFYNYK